MSTTLIPARPDESTAPKAGWQATGDTPDRWPRHVGIGAGAYALAAGVTAIAGWAFDLPRLTDWRNDGISMFPNTALCAALSGAAILLAPGATSWSRPAVRVLAAFVASLGGLTLLEHLAGVSFGLDTLLFERTWGQAAAAAPMRMGPPASLSFLLAGLALGLLTGGHAARRVGARLSVIVVAIGMLSLTGHLYGASQMYTLPHLTGIAMPTASVLVALALGILGSLPEQEPVRTLLDRGAAGALTRRALPSIAVVALALGAARVAVERAGLVDGPFGTALRTLIELALLMGLLWWAAAIIRRHERALRASELEVRRQSAQLAAFLDTAAIALHRVGPDGTILWANDAELQTLGYRADEYIGHPIAEFHVDPAAIADILARLRRGERLCEYPARMRAKSGDVRNVLIDSSVLWEEGRFVHTQCFTRDVTEQVRTGAAESLLTSIVASSDDAIISKDLDGTITSWNRGAERLFGYSASEAIGQNVTMLIPDGRNDEEPRILSRIHANERVDHYETVRRCKDGRLLDISLTVSPIVGPNGTVIGASKIARDISDRKRLAEQREVLLRASEHLRSEAETANRQKDEFLAMLGHELRNPLSAVRNAIAAAMLDESSRERALEIARRQTQQLERIVDDLLDVARITQGRVRLRRAPVVVGELLQRAVDGARSLIEDRGHSLTLKVAPQPMVLEGDAARLEQAISNLLANAAKYTEPGGAITLAAEQIGENVTIRVRDNGMGIPPHLLEKVFDLFAQGDRSLDRAQGGLGIGLTVVRSIVELHGGTVAALSPGPGGGSEFILVLPALPLASPEAARDTASPTRIDGLATPARVLMVEDQPDAAESLLMILELLGHHVRVAHDGLAALEAARATPPDIMLIDIGLPGMNGYDLARAIRREPTLQRAVLVALTGYGRPEDREQAMAAGFDYHLVKPVDVAALGNLVAQFGSRAPAGDDPSTRH